MIHVFEAATADEVWAQVAARIEGAEDVLFQPSRIGNTVELLHTTVSIRDPRQRWVLGREPAINPAFAIAEVVWILAGRNDAAFLNHWNPALPKFAGHTSVYHGAYGYRLRRNLGFDQLTRAFGTLCNNPTSRQVVLQIWDSAIDLPTESGAPRDADIPCNICSMLKVRENRLDWMQVLRSNDLFLGVPHNLVQFTSLQEVVAGWLGVELGAYHQLSDSLHIYEKDLPHLQERLDPTRLRNSDSLMLSKPDSDVVWAELDHRMNSLVNAEAITQKAWTQLTPTLDIPKAFNNLWAIVLADDARRRGWPDEAAESVSRCANPVLQRAWERWAERKQGRNLRVPSAEQR